MVVLVAGLAAALFANAPAARAQNALGDGRALDNNLRQGSGGRNDKNVNDTTALIKFNNAVITGQAGGGKSFRGSLGYTAPNEFRGATGTDSLYGFERDSSASSMVGGQLRSSDVLAAQAALSMGRPVSPDMVGVGVLTRASAAASGSTLSALRATSQYQWELSRQPSVLGVVPGSSPGKSDRLLTSSTLRSVGFSVPNRADMLPLSPLERPQNLRDLEVPSGRSDAVKLGPDGKPENDPRTPDRILAEPVAGGRADARVAQPPTQRISTRYDEVQARLRESAERNNMIPKTRGEGDNPATDGKDGKDAKDMKDGRNILDGAREKVGPLEPGKAEMERLRKQLGLPPEPDKPDVDPAAAGRDSKDPANRLRINRFEESDPAVKTLRDLQNTEPFDSLGAKPAGPQDWYNIVMDRAQEQVNAGQYFEAEGTYTRLLSAVPQDVMAQVGRAHAQLGAGAFLSAATGLGGVFRAHGDMMAIRFGANALIPRTRANDIAIRLQAELAEKNSSMHDEATLLLGYLGYQFGEKAWLETAVKHVDNVRDENRAIAEMLAGIWSNPPASAPPPAVPAPVTPPANPAPAGEPNK